MPAWRKCFSFDACQTQKQTCAGSRDAGLFYVHKYHATENYVEIHFLLVVIAPIPPLN